MEPRSTSAPASAPAAASAAAAAPPASDAVHPSPYVPPESSVAEVTVRAVVLGLVLSVLMGAANTYLGLRVGMTVSASIPAAVISMGILRGLLRRGTILENNIVQTMASAGESLAAGAIFTVPAIVLVGEWQEFRFWPTTMIVMLGGVLGIIFMVPMRRALIVDRPDLRYPEGVACGEVLVVGEEGGSGMRAVAGGVGIGAVFAVLLRGVQVIVNTVQHAWVVGRSVLYIGTDMSAALLGVGYIVGLEIAVLITLGGAIGWLVAMPILGGGTPGADAVALADHLWDTHIRFIGVGTMLVGGVHSILSVRHGLVHGFRALGRSRSGGEGGAAAGTPRTERDISLGQLGIVFILAVVGTLALYQFLTESLGISVVATVAMVVTSFLFVAVATYIAGLVGSSNSPVSGMTICALLITAAVLLALGIAQDKAILATLGVAGVVCCAACTSGDVAQDLKTGLLVGATPQRQQVVEIVATVATAFFFAPILTLLHHAYVIGSELLPAPQAGLFASLTRGLFGHGEIPWNMVGVGALIGAGLLVLNGVLAWRGVRFRAHIMPVAVGIYLPFSLDIPILFGGLLRFFMARRNRSATGDAAHDPGVLFGSGLIAGEALMGIALAIPIAAGVALPVALPAFLHLGGVVQSGLASLVLFAGLLWLYAAVARRRA